jgi:hypothetical protein
LRSPRHSAARLESRRLRSRRYRSWSIRNARLRELGGALRIANRPSDKEGERAVGDALAIVHRCQ